MTLASPFRRTTLFVLLASSAALPSSAWSSAAVPLTPSMSLANEEYSAWIEARNAEWREAFDKAPAACQALVLAEIPPASGAWCRHSLGYPERAIAAAPTLLLVAATSERNGLKTGLGALHELVNHPDAQAQDSSGRTYRDEVFHIVGTAMHRSILRSDAIDAMIGELTQLCLRLHASVTGGYHGLVANEVHDHATLACLRATAVLELERYGAPRLTAPSLRAWPDGELQKTLGPAVFAVQQRELHGHGMENGPVASSSLLVMQRFITGMLQPCYRFIHRSMDLGCSLP
ncbi:hypothetical protein [Silanimonas sp.]|uniref:hypothetical protein n=1 Tax=Silanimonas sp. TaxID=1929290 RepID=UPI0037CB5930